MSLAQLESPVTPDEHTSTADVGWLNGQLSRVGVSQQLGDDFVCDTGELVGRKVHPKHSDSWRKSVDLEILAAKYEQFFGRVRELAKAVYAQRVLIDGRT